MMESTYKIEDTYPILDNMKEILKKKNQDLGNSFHEDYQEFGIWNAHTFWRDSLGNGGYWITRPRMSEERLKELKDKGIDVYND